MAALHVQFLGVSLALLLVNKCDAWDDALWPTLFSYARKTQPSTQLEVRYSYVKIISFWEGWVVYQETSRGLLFRDQYRQLPEERSDANSVRCATYSLLASFSTLYPEEVPTIVSAVSSFGIKPDDSSAMARLCLGIGSKVGQHFFTDTFNQDGSKSDNRFFKRPFADYTGFQPENTPYDIKEITKFQPEVFFVKNLAVVQEFNCPFFGEYPSPLFKHPFKYAHLVPPPATLNAKSPEFKQQAEHIIGLSSGLTDEQKMLAELFSSAKVFEALKAYLAQASGVPPLKQQVVIELLQAFAAFHSHIPIIHFKRKFETSKPKTVIRKSGLFQKIKAWGGPCLGTVGMQASEWSPYLTQGPDPDYPSGGVCIFTSIATVMQMFLGVDKTPGFNITFLKGSSTVEPGCTPATDVTINIPTLSSIAELSADASLFGGIHFKDATTTSLKLCKTVAEDSVFWVMKNLVVG